MEEWNTKYNSELTTIKNKSYISGWVWGFIAGCAISYIVYQNF